MTVQTLLEVAATFDVALQIRFVPFFTFLQQTRDVSTHSMRVVSFSNDSFARSGGQEIRIPSRAPARSIIIDEFVTPAIEKAWLEVPTRATPTNLGVEVRAN